MWILALTPALTNTQTMRRMGYRSASLYLQCYVLEYKSVLLFSCDVRDQSDVLVVYAIVWHFYSPRTNCFFYFMVHFWGEFLAHFIWRLVRSFFPINLCSWLCVSNIHFLILQLFIIISYSCLLLFLGNIRHRWCCLTIIPCLELMFYFSWIIWLRF